MYTAIIIEPRRHKALPFVLKNFLENLNDKWNFIIFHGTNNQEYIENILDTDLELYKNRIQMINLNVSNLLRNQYDTILKTKEFYENIPTETFLIFQVDTLIIKENKHLIHDFLEYEYVGAPWTDGVVGNGGLSLRKKSKMLEIIEKYDCVNNVNHPNEDEFFTRQTQIPLLSPNFEKAKQFSVETCFYDKPFGIHNCWNHISNNDWNLLTSKYPELEILYGLNNINKVANECEFSIMYIANETNLKSLECSILSLQNFLDFTNVYEVLIYTHDIVYADVINMLDKIQMKQYITFRIIPVHYNYHEYIKHMQIKTDCYKECKTKYIVLLDHVLCLKQFLDLKSLIRSDGKIEWKYLRLQDDLLNPEFPLWKKAYEDATRTPKVNDYINVIRPFVFTRNSLEEAAHKFRSMHNCDYEEYCYNRCNSENISYTISIKSPANKRRLCKVFSEIEYLGFFCQYFSREYVFTYINKLEENEYFITNETPKEENQIEQDKITIVYKTYKTDLEWLKYSLLSLQKFLDFTNVYELIIYTHDVVYSELLTILDDLQMKQYITFRVIPVHYNYHGYVKQMQVKADCYKDCKSQYIVLLDSDLVLKKHLNFHSLIREDGKIEWKYLRLQDDPSNEVFKVWKKACEDSTHSPKINHYMSNGFPFIFTRNSLEEAADKFIDMHNCDYEGYCKNRCDHYNIKVEHGVRDIFSSLSQVFTEFEYLGFYCHHFSNDYVFTNTPYCLMELQHEKEDDHSYFIQYWSHGGINDSYKNRIKKILGI